MVNWLIAREIYWQLEGKSPRITPKKGKGKLDSMRVIRKERANRKDWVIRKCDECSGESERELLFIKTIPNYSHCHSLECISKIGLHYFTVHCKLWRDDAPRNFMTKRSYPKFPVLCQFQERGHRFQGGRDGQASTNIQTLTFSEFCESTLFPEFSPQAAEVISEFHFRAPVLAIYPQLGRILPRLKWSGRRSRYIHLEEEPRSFVVPQWTEVWRNIYRVRGKFRSLFAA